MICLSLLSKKLNIRDTCFSGLRQVEENQLHVKEEEDRKNEAQEQLERTSKILSEMKTGVEHLAEKLKIFKAVSIYLRLRQIISSFIFGLSSTTSSSDFVLR